MPDKKYALFNRLQLKKKVPNLRKVPKTLTTAVCHFEGPLRGVRQRPLDFYLASMFGRNMTIEGMNVIINKQPMRIAKNGIIPFRITSTGSFAIREHTNRFVPKGGVV